MKKWLFLWVLFVSDPSTVHTWGSDYRGVWHLNDPALFSSLNTTDAVDQFSNNDGWAYRIFENFVLGYAYELPLSYDYQITSWTHEIALRFDFQFLIKKTQSLRRF